MENRAGNIYPNQQIVVDLSRNRKRNNNNLRTRLARTAAIFPKLIEIRLEIPASTRQFRAVTRCDVARKF